VVRSFLVPVAVVVVTVVAVAAGCGGTKTVTETVTVTTPAETTAEMEGTPREIVQFGYVKELESKGDKFELRFDPALFLSGETANVAAAEDGMVEPGEPVPNDNYTVDEGHRLFTYFVAPDAHVTVLTRDSGNFGEKTVTVAELAEIVAGTSSIELFEPITTGFWMTYRIDTVSSLEQQYRP
jgi:hypothetical protein